MKCGLNYFNLHVFDSIRINCMIKLSMLVTQQDSIMDVLIPQRFHLLQKTHHFALSESKEELNKTSQCDSKSRCTSLKASILWISGAVGSVFGQDHHYYLCDAINMITLALLLYVRHAKSNSFPERLMPHSLEWYIKVLIFGLKMPKYTITHLRASVVSKNFSRILPRPQ
jgi:hypothetical protein